MRLLNRTTRSVTVTEAGRQLLLRLSPALDEIRAAIDAVNSLRESPTGTLRVNMPTFVAQVVLPPIATAFLSMYPGIVLEAVAEDRFVDVLAEGFDAGIRYEERLERDMIAVPIGPRTQHFASAASPIYLDKHGRPKHPRELLDHACIRHRFPSGVTPPWEFERNGRVLRISPAGPMVASTIDLELSAAVAGLGVISTFEEWLTPSIANGQLEPILTDWWQQFSGPYLYYPSRRYVPAPLRLFIDFLKSRQRQEGNASR
jgi:DNA-binding transcriptional LysR family regulator